MNENGLAPFANEKYINLTTFRKSDKAVPTAVWFVIQNGRLYVHTGSQTGKAKRLRANGRAQVSVSDARGNPKGEFIPADGRQVEDAERIAAAEAAFCQKYGLQYLVLELLTPFRRGRIGDSVIFELELKPNAPE
ncbi:MAG: PPOX class F420-dependent oxidoreductase [Anaerolineae bacterium]